MAERGHRAVARSAHVRERETDRHAPLHHGSDAVAGVVNIITRENYQGFEAGGSFSTTDEGGLDTQRARFLGGIGDRRPQTTGGRLVDYAGSNLGASFSLPQNKATTTLEWNIASVRTALTWYHTGGYDQKASTVATAVQSRVDAYEQFDLYTGWSSDSDNLTVYAKFENLFDEQPPYDASFPGIRAPYDFTQYDLRGRAFLIGLDYRL